MANILNLFFLFFLVWLFFFKNTNNLLKSTFIISNLFARFVKDSFVEFKLHFVNFVDNENFLKRKNQKIKGYWCMTLTTSHEINFCCVSIYLECWIYFLKNWDQNSWSSSLIWRSRINSGEIFPWTTNQGGLFRDLTSDRRFTMYLSLELH